MNLQQLTNMQPVYQELKIINKKMVIDNVVVEILGFTLYDKVLNLYVLEYDEVAWAAERDLQELPANKQSRRPETNRERLTKEGQIEYQLAFNSVKKIEIDGLVLQVSGSSSGRLGSHDMQDLMLINEFIRLGFRPSKVIETVEFAGMMLTELRVEGDFKTIPVPDYCQEINITQAECFKDYPTNKQSGSMSRGSL